MKRSIFTHEQIVGILPQANTGVIIVNIRRQNGIQIQSVQPTRPVKWEFLTPLSCASG